MLYLFKITDYNRINLLDALVQYISEIYYIGFTPKIKHWINILSQILRLAQPSQPRHTNMILTGEFSTLMILMMTHSCKAECLSSLLSSLPFKAPFRYSSRYIKMFLKAYHVLLIPSSNILWGSRWWYVAGRWLGIVQGVGGASVTSALRVRVTSLASLQMCFCVLRKVVWAHESLVTSGTREPLLSSVGPQVSLELIWAGESLATEKPVTHKWPLSRVPP